jgi:hypothetical protein
MGDPSLRRCHGNLHGYRSDDSAALKPSFTGGRADIRIEEVAPPLNTEVKDKKTYFERVTGEFEMNSSLCPGPLQ